jgi:uncharacterized protein YecE (DUF72 family)
VPKGIRVAVEFRHPSWHREEIFQLLERRGAAYCIMSGSRLPCILRATAFRLCAASWARPTAPLRRILFG